mmetsp:Transcript_73730/g.198657  ORF Transcript_73730/g.198657 Transcript_73730/m.198657 type:complete len:488 (-) Transcript_73730:662-2125(-)
MNTAQEKLTKSINHGTTRRVTVFTTCLPEQPATCAPPSKGLMECAPCLGTATKVGGGGQHAHQTRLGEGLIQRAPRHGTTSTNLTRDSHEVRLSVVWQQAGLSGNLKAGACNADHASDHDQEAKQAADHDEEPAALLPWCAEAHCGVVSDEFLLRGPLRHPVEILILQACMRVRGVRLSSMRFHVLGRRDVALAILRGCQRCHGAALVREGALPREGEVQPLGEQPAMQRHLPAMRIRDHLQLRRQRALQLQLMLLLQSRGMRAEVAHDCQDLAWLRRGGTDAALDLVQHTIAVIDAADQVVLRRDDAIRGRLNVVRNDDLLAAPARLVQGTQLPQVLLRLSEAPFRVQAMGVELRQRHSASVVRIHLHQRGLHGATLRVPEGGKGLRDAADDAMGVLERIARLHRVVPRPSRGLCTGQGRGLLPLEVQSLDLAIHEADNLVPVGNRALKQRAVARENLDALLVVANHPPDHVGLQELLHALTAQRP